MNKEEIEKRIIICEERSKGYREVGKNFIADKYDNEKYKWEKVLSDLELLNERKIKDLLEYKKAYYNEKEVIDKAINDIQQIIDEVNKNTIMSIKQFNFKLEVIQNELKGLNDY